MKIINKKIPLYHQNLKIVVANNFNKVLKKLNITEKYGDVNSYGGFVLDGLEDITVVLRPNATVGGICHEATHIVNLVFKRSVAKLDIDNDEPQAYLMQWVAETLYEETRA